MGILNPEILSKRFDEQKEERERKLAEFEKNRWNEYRTFAELNKAFISSKEEMTMKEMIDKVVEDIDKSVNAIANQNNINLINAWHVYKRTFEIRKASSKQGEYIMYCDISDQA